MKSSVIGRPVLLALEDVDGTPSFLEKALNFMEEYGGSSAFPNPPPLELSFRISFLWYFKM